MLDHDVQDRSASVPWRLVTTLGVLVLLLLGVGRITVSEHWGDRPTESSLRSSLRLMEKMVPPGFEVLARQADPVTRDVIMVLQRGPAQRPDWTNVIILWDPISIPGVFVGVADQPIALPLESAGTNLWRRFLTDARVRLLPVVRPEAMKLPKQIVRLDIGPLIRIDPCLDH